MITGSASLTYSSVWIIGAWDTGHNAVSSIISSDYQGQVVTTLRKLKRKCSDLKHWINIDWLDWFLSSFSQNV